MNFHGKDIKIFTGSSNVNVAKGIAGSLGVPLGKSECTQFSDGEIAELPSVLPASAWNG